MATERKERVIVTEDEDIARKQRVVEHHVSAQRVIVSRISQFIWLLVASLNVLLMLRFIMKLIAANPGNTFVDFLYTVTGFFTYPFQSIVTNPTFENGAIVDMSVIFAMLVYAFAAWALVVLIRILFSDAGGTRNVTTYEKIS